MNDIQSVTIDADIEHDMRAKHCTEICTRLRGNEQNLERNRINVQNFLKLSEKLTGMQTRLKY